MFKPSTITSRYCSVLTCKRFVSLSQLFLEYFVWQGLCLQLDAASVKTKSATFGEI